MKKFNPFKKNKSPYRITDKVRVKNSYYTFSEEYPRDRFQISRRKKLLSRRRKLRIAVSAISFVLIFILAYFGMSISLSISNAPIDTKNEVILDTTKTDKLKEDGIRALYMPSAKLSDKEYIKDFIREIRRKFNIMGVSVNGMANVRCNAELAELLRECERRGFIIIREERYEHD